MLFDGPLISQSLSSPWKSIDIGEPATSGSAASSDGTFTVEASGTDIGGTSDEFHFVYRPIDGDVDVTARVDSVAPADNWSKAGLMIRASLKANAAYAFAFVSAGKGLALQSRRAARAASELVPVSGVRAPHWVRVVRAGKTVRAYFSSNGTSWTLAGTIEVALGTVAYVGLAVTSRAPSALTVARFSNVHVEPLSDMTPLPDGLVSADIGGSSAKGRVRHTEGTYRVSGAGADISEAHDQFHFVYRPVKGDVDIRVRVAGIQHVHRLSNAGVMIRESLAADSRHALARISAGMGAAFQRRVDTGAHSDHTDGGSIRAPGWVRLVRTGTTIEAFRSSDGMSWTSLGSDVIPMGAAAYVGLAVTSHADDLAEGVFDELSISAMGAAVNRPPSVVLTSPLSGTTFTAGANITLTAVASDADGRVTRVEFLAGDLMVGSDTTAPFAFTWPSATAGTHQLSAFAYDDDGANAQSPSASVTVTPKSGDTALRMVVFEASASHGKVKRYVLEIFRAGDTPGRAAPVAISDLGKPKPNGKKEVSVDRSSLFSALASGHYIATVRAENHFGFSRSAAVAFTR